MSDEPPPKLWREELTRAYVELRGSRVTPLRGAVSVALGLWVGSIPAFGLHTPIVLALCLWLRLDGLLAWVASNVSNPAFAPFLLYGEVQMGAYVLTGAPLDHFDVQAARDTGVSGVILYAFAGSPFVATGIAALGLMVVYGYLSAYRDGPTVTRRTYALPDHAPAWWHAAERVAARLAPEEEGRTRFQVTRIELVTDPAPERWAKWLASPDRLDIVGPKSARAALALLELGVANAAWALDPEAEAAAAAAARSPALAMQVEADPDAPLPSADALLWLEALSSRPLVEQEALLRRAVDAVSPQGRLLLQVYTSGRGLGTLLSRLRGRRLRSAAAWAGRLEADGFTTEITRAGLGRVLICATRS